MNIYILMKTTVVDNFIQFMIDWLIDWCLTPTYAIFQLYRGMNSIDEHTHIFYTFTLTIKFVYTPAT